MSKLVVVLSLTTALFAASTAWLTWRLRETQASHDAPNRPPAAWIAQREAEASAAAQEDAAASAHRQLESFARGENRPGVATSAGTAPAMQSRPDPNREMMRTYANQLLKRLEDPAQRADIIRATRSRLDSQYSRLKDQLELSDHAYDRLLDVMANDFTDQQERHSRCVLDPACDPSKFAFAMDGTGGIEAVLGSEKYQAFKKYQEVAAERQMVTQLRSRLSDANFLRDSEADRLVGAMAEEGRAIQADMQASGADVRGFGDGSGMIWYTSGGGVEQQMASARRNAERIRDRAASVLTAAQLRIFVQMQEEALDNLASMMGENGG